MNKDVVCECMRTSIYDRFGVPACSHPTHSNDMFLIFFACSKCMTEIATLPELCCSFLFKSTRCCVAVAFKEPCRLPGRRACAVFSKLSIIQLAVIGLQASIEAGFPHWLAIVLYQDVLVVNNLKGRGVQGDLTEGRPGWGGFAQLDGVGPH